ncbi:undecaprenyl-diphosphatase [Paenibacillus sp. Mc5Re-14]|uniref:undecaprenyl-diphosphatase n=1 Tax=Paenibacillus sp. Mc5Re-14 TaxID=1030529 RepID=UPI000B86786A|nr:undecaprenyl-diphosphatase [Paenibacillus sp. Mc5Re-14]
MVLSLDISEVNISLFRWVNDLGKEYPFLNPTFIFIAEYMVFLLAISVLFIWFTRNKDNRVMILCASIAFICAFVIGKVSGLFHSNFQPFVELTDVNKLIHKEKDNSFPSDHTILFFSYCFSFWLFKRGRSILWVLLAVLVGVSRIWVGVHYPLDVLTGIFISLAAATFIYLIVPSLRVTQSVINIYEKYENKLLLLFKRTRGNKSKNF